MSRGLNEDEANELLKIGSLSGMLDRMALSFKNQEFDCNMNNEELIEYGHFRPLKPPIIFAL